MRPQYRRFGFIDFDAMGSATAGDLDGTDEIVVRQNGGDNVVATISQIPVGGGVPDPLLLNNGSAGAPTYSFTTDPDTGMFRLGANQLGFAVNGIAQFVINPTELSAVVAGGPLIRNFDSTAIIPNIITDSGDVNTGLGSAGADILSFIAGGVEGLRVTEAAGLININTLGPLLAPDGTAAAPSYSWSADPDTGFFRVGNGFIGFSDNGTEQWRIGASLIQGVGVGAGAGEGPALFNRIPTDVLPTVFPRRDDLDTGMGSNAANQFSLIAGGIEGLRIEQIGGVLQLLSRTEGTTATPAYSFIGDKDTGVTQLVLNTLSLIAGGIEIARAVTNNQFTVVGGSVSSPGLAFLGDLNTGLHNVLADQINIIAGGLDCINVSGSAGRKIGFYGGSPIALQTGVAVTTSAIHAALVSLRLITA